MGSICMPLQNLVTSILRIRVRDYNLKGRVISHLIKIRYEDQTPTRRDSAREKFSPIRSTMT
jgi:hypothetical protein